MKFSDFFSRLVAFLLIPVFFCSPLSTFCHDSYLPTQSHADPFNETKLITFDEVLDYIKRIEDGSLEYKCNTSNFDSIYHWIITLAWLRVVPGDIEAERVLNESILDLMDAFDIGWEYAMQIITMYSLSSSLIALQA
ncbi:MAG: hypothetical protein FJZ57_05310 [Chlamydiae bacterium]|nr:hypothetical protein [Chlamydiota bacterium]